MKRVASRIVASLLMLIVLSVFGTHLEVGRNYGDMPFSGVVLATSGLSPEVRINPDKYTFVVERGVGLGYRFNATVELYDATWLFAWQVRVYFNNTLLNATNAFYHPEEPIHTVPHVEVSPAIENGYNGTHGYVQLGVSAIYPSYVNATAESYPLGLGICYMEFEVLASPPSGSASSSDLSLNNTDTRLRKDPSTIIPCTKKNGSYSLTSANIKVPTDYSTIQAAINAAIPGNTVFVYNGTYPENVVINKTIMLFGQKKEITLINKVGGVEIYVNNSNSVIVDGFTISSGSQGMYVFSSENVTISNNMIANNSGDGIYGYAVSSDDSNNLDVHSNTIVLNGGNGIIAVATGYVGDCNSWVFYDNDVSQNGGRGIYANSGYEGRIGSWRFYRNRIESNKGEGIRAEPKGDSYSHCNDWELCGNNVTGNGSHGLYAYTYYSGGQCNSWRVCYNRFAANNGSGILASSDQYYQTSRIDSWIIRGNQIVQNKNSGIQAFGSGRNGNYGYCNGWSVSENNISKNAFVGIYICSFDNQWSIFDNSIESNQYGIHITYGSHLLRRNTIRNCTMNFGIDDSYIQDVDSSNTVDGKPIYYWINRDSGEVPSNAGYIALVSSKNVTIRDALLSHNGQGVLLANSAGITMLNITTSFNERGICVVSSSNCSVYRSQALNNTYGVYMKNSTICAIQGINFEKNGYGVYLSDSSNNTICHNNFLQNDHQSTTFGLASNAWNLSYPLGGNYWLYHTGPDWCSGPYQNETASDGLVDTNMTINQNNIDYYPLSAPWSSPVHIIVSGNTTYRNYNTTLGSASISLTFTTDFVACWIGYSLDGQPNATIAGNATLTDLTCGYHRVIICANDTIGNMYFSLEVQFAITYLSDINYDKNVDIDDLVETTWRYGSVPGDSRWSVYADVNRDGIIDVEDIAFVARDYGKTWK